MYVLVLVIYILGVPPAPPSIAVVMHDFAKQEKCEEVATLTQAMIRTQLETGGKVVWRCVSKEESVVRTRIGEEVVPTLLQSPGKQ